MKPIVKLIAFFCYTFGKGVKMTLLAKGEALVTEYNLDEFKLYEIYQ